MIYEPENPIKWVKVCKKKTSKYFSKSFFVKSKFVFKVTFETIGLLFLSLYLIPQIPVVSNSSNFGKIYKSYPISFKFGLLVSPFFLKKFSLNFSMPILSKFSCLTIHFVTKGFTKNNCSNVFFAFSNELITWLIYLERFWFKLAWYLINVRSKYILNGLNSSSFNLLLSFEISTSKGSISFWLTSSSHWGILCLISLDNSSLEWNLINKKIGTPIMHRITIIKAILILLFIVCLYKFR